MKLCIENLTTLFLIAVILLGGCSGCGQKTDPETPIVPPNQSTPDNTTKLPSIKQNGTKPKPRGKTAKLSPRNFRNMKFLASLNNVEYVQVAREHDGGIPFPWEPTTVHLETWKKIIRIERDLFKRMRSGELPIDDFNEKHLQLFRDIGLLTWARIVVDLSGSSIDEKTIALVNLAYKENPDDFETLLTWVFAGGNQYDLYGEEKTTATRRLSEMNPNHPWVLHKLAKCILGTNPQEALGYAQKAQELDPSYLHLGVEGLCYYQMGNYKKALTAFKRSHAAAVKRSPPHIIRAITWWVEMAKRTVNNPEKGADNREKIRKVGNPILGLDLPIIHY